MARKSGAPEIETEIEITPEMIEAGAREYYWTLSDSPSEEDVKKAVREIFISMVRVARQRELFAIDHS